jgi:large subunit ribosomal protein L5
VACRSHNPHLFTNIDNNDPTMQFVTEQQNNAYAALKEAQGYVNTMQAPRVEKVVLSTGVGKVSDKAKLTLIQDRLARIAGQKVSPRKAKKSIASFKLREGDVVGYQITLRGARMNDFLEKLIHVALPRTRDFRGLEAKAIDEMGNITIGIREHTVFPETSDEDIKDVFGLSITIVTTARTKAEAEAFLRHLGVPLKA